MKPLIVLLSLFTITLFIIRLVKKNYNYALSGRIAMSGMLLFTAIAHFAFSQGMTMMLPDFIPYKSAIIYLTGFIEIAIAIGLLIPKLKNITAWVLILFFLLILPANIYAALNHIDYQHATATGPGPSYLLFRIPLQIFFIAWTYISSIKGK